MIAKITVMSEAAALSLRGSSNKALVSITGPGRVADLLAPDEWGALLRVQFSDAEYDGAMLERLARRGLPFDPDSKGFPSERTARSIRDFLDRLQGQTDIEELAIHCHAGKRRSVAVARYAAEQYGVTLEQPHDGGNLTVYGLLCEPTRYQAALRGLSPRSTWLAGVMKLVARKGGRSER